MKMETEKRKTLQSQSQMQERIQKLEREVRRLRIQRETSSMPPARKLVGRIIAPKKLKTSCFSVGWSDPSNVVSRLGVRPNKIDASKIASRLGVQLTDLAGALNVDVETLQATPDATKLQESLAPIERSLDILDQAFHDSDSISAWLNTSHPELDGKTPLDTILAGWADAVCGMLENAIQGIPT